MSHTPAAYFILTFFHAGTDAHLQHLSTRSYAQHKALQEFYEGIVELIDSYAEAYQGKYGLIEQYPTFYKRMKRVEDLTPILAEMRQDLPADSELQNILDEVAALIDSTVYKLKFLT